MADNFGLKIGLEGEKEFKKAIADITSVTQTANKINWLVKSGTSASDFTMSHCGH